MSGRGTTQPRSPEQLMTWRAPRLTRRAHVLLLIAVAAIALVVGTHLIDALVVDDAVAVFGAVLWGWTVGCAAVAYAQGVIYR